MTRAALAALLLVGLVGCGDDEVDPTAEAVAGVASVVAERLGVDPAAVAVTCPQELAIDVGSRFQCAVQIGEADPIDLDFAVAADGTVELQRAVVPTAAAEDYLAGELAGPAEGPVQVDCGAPPLIVKDVGDQFSCTATRADGTAHSVVVTVLTLDGTVRYEVAPVATTTTTPP